MANVKGFTEGFSFDENSYYLSKSELTNYYWFDLAVPTFFFKFILNSRMMDKELLKKCAQNDRKAQAKLYEYCFHKLMPLCYRFHRNEENARSVLNQGFLKIIKNLKTFREDVSFDAWINRIMKNTIIDDLRKKKKYIQNVDIKETDRELDYFATSVENQAMSDFEVETIKELIEQLPSITQKVFNLYVISGYNHREIGELLEISDGTSKWHLSNARKMLQKLINERRATKGWAI